MAAKYVSVTEVANNRMLCLRIDR